MKAFKTITVALAMAASLVACGGGGGDSAPAAPPDARNGDYVAFASNGQQYTMNVNFDAKTMSFANGGTTLSTTFAAVGGSSTQFKPASSSTVTGGSTDGFTVLTDGVVGSINLNASTGPVAFIAARNFVTTLADAAGNYNFLSRTTLGGVNTLIYQGRISADGHLAICNSAAVDNITTCSPSSTSTLTVSAGVFSAFDGTNTIPIRIAKMGTERVYLRADTAAGDSRFTVGMPETSGYAAGTFDGRDNGINQVSYTYDGASAFTLTYTPPTGAAGTITGTASALGSTQPQGLRGVVTGADGNFFSMRNGSLGVVFSARGNVIHPGYVLIAPAR